MFKKKKKVRKMYTGDEAKSIQYICKQGKFFFLKIQEAI